MKILSYLVTPPRGDRRVIAELYSGSIGLPCYGLVESLSEHYIDWVVFPALKFKHFCSSCHLKSLRQLLLATKFGTILLTLKKMIEVHLYCNSKKKKSYFVTKATCGILSSLFFLIVKVLSIHFRKFVRILPP